MKKSIVILGFLLCLGCVGCGKGPSKVNSTITEQINVEESVDKSENNDEIKSNVKENEFPKRYKEDSDNVKFNTEIIVSDEIIENGMDIISATLQEINSEDAYETLMGTIELQDKGESDTQLWYEGVNNEILTITPYSLGY